MEIAILTIIVSVVISVLIIHESQKEHKERLKKIERRLNEIESSIDEIKRNTRITDKRINLRDFIVFEKLKELEKERLNEDR
nr:hypothetical protein [Helcococcus sueciensis]